MANVSVYNMEGKQIDTIELNDAVFGVEVNEHLVHMAVVQQLACDGGDDKAYRDRQHDLHNSHTILLLPSAPRGGLFFISAFPSGARPR